ncbi:hypothetical protein F4820DRAFT_446068 [Hypoxylon rubiginosum]|uniref:Uncharacterized protein n=1 Tax=Hypoxylon rubiginosum TaxID=110542 RepID=A0ACB9Z7H0_9PEZI|nr:hypothetical protein F4820DRAFT_446068 [Hypoxylon rubiginosum]
MANNQALIHLTYRDLFLENREVFSGDHTGDFLLVILALRMAYSHTSPLSAYDPFERQTGVILAGNVSIRLDIEMLRPLPLFYRQFVSASGVFRRLVEVDRKEISAWKIVLIALYGGVGNSLSLDTLQYGGQSYIKAMKILVSYHAEAWVRVLVGHYFRAYCHRMVEIARAVPVYAANGIARQDAILMKIDKCANLFHQCVPEDFIGIPVWAFGCWALRAIDFHHLNCRMSQLSPLLQVLIRWAAEIILLMEEEDEANCATVSVYGRRTNPTQNCNTFGVD